ncbi:MAG: YafY family protein [Balneolales bacterium]
MNSTQRRQKLFYLIQSGKALSVNKIATEYGISKRTVYRDLRLLQDSDVPLTYDPDEGYGIMRGGTIPPLMFTTKQLATVMMGLSFVKSQIDEILVDDAREVELKINSVIPSELKDFMNAMDEKTIVDPHKEKVSIKKKGGNWFAICTAISNKKTLAFSYHDKTNKYSERVMDPLLLVFYNDHWNAIGHCHTRREPRNFILDRMSNLVVSDEPLLNYHNYAKEELLYRKNGKKNEIVVTISKNTLRKFIAALPAQIHHQVETENSRQRITFEFDNLEYLNEWLLSFADDIRVEKPEELKDMRKLLLDQMIQQLR